MRPRARRQVATRRADKIKKIKHFPRYTGFLLTLVGGGQTKTPAERAEPAALSYNTASQPYGGDAWQVRRMEPSQRANSIAWLSGRAHGIRSRFQWRRIAPIGSASRRGSASNW